MGRESASTDGGAGGVVFSQPIRARQRTGAVDPKRSFEGRRLLTPYILPPDDSDATAPSHVACRLVNVWEPLAKRTSRFLERFVYFEMHRSCPVPSLE